MTAVIQGQPRPNYTPPPGDHPAILFAAPDERQAALEAADILAALDAAPDGSRATRYESHTLYDYLVVTTPPRQQAPPTATPAEMELYLTATHLLVVGGEEDGWAWVMERLGQLPAQDQLPATALQLVFAWLWHRDDGQLERLEVGIAAMEEDAVRENAPQNFTRQVIALRKHLMRLKRYYGGLYDLLEDLEENPNKFIPDDQLPQFHLHTNRADRTVNAVDSLQDYLSQVRDAYQNQIDIGLNKTMRLFTVLTTIFFPLTLIAGWYGMNLQMPEVAMPWAYPVVIFVSVLIVAVSLLVFKRKGWF